MSLIVSRRGNIVAPGTGNSKAIVLSSSRRSRTRQSGNNNNGASQQPRQQVVLAQVSRSGGARRRPRRRRGNGGGITSVQAPSTFGGLFVAGTPAYRGGGSSGSLVVSHRELVTNVIGTTAFNGLRIPMIPSTFPWLDGPARCFSRYRWLSLSVEFITSSPTSQGGTIAMGAAYDGLDALPNSIEEVSSLSHGFSGPVWGPPGVMGRVVFDPQRWSKPWYSYIPSEPEPNRDPISRADEVNYVPAFLLFGRATQVNGQPIGRLAVSYSIEFLDPIPSRLNTDPLPASLAASFRRAVKWGDEGEVEQDPVRELTSTLANLLAAAVPPTPAPTQLSRPEPIRD